MATEQKYVGPAQSLANMALNATVGRGRPPAR
jgi:hypothetical protein